MDHDEVKILDFAETSINCQPLKTKVNFNIQKLKKKIIHENIQKIFVAKGSKQKFQFFASYQEAYQVALF